jgi:hypothetical protein
MMRYVFRTRLVRDTFDATAARAVESGASHFAM